MGGLYWAGSLTGGPKSKIAQKILKDEEVRAPYNIYQISAFRLLQLIFEQSRKLKKLSLFALQSARTLLHLKILYEIWGFWLSC